MRPVPVGASAVLDVVVTPEMTVRFDELLELSARFFAGEEGQEGIAAFREKRPARWVPTAG